MDGISQLVDIINTYNKKGFERLNDNTYLVCKTPHIAPEAWLHAIYGSLVECEINTLDESLDCKMPSQYKSLLSQMNGCSIFSGTVELFGKRKNYNRDVKSVWQPFDIVKPNTVERIDISEEFFVIGSYNWDGSLISFDNTGQIIRCSRSTGNVLNSWLNFDEFLMLEGYRIKDLFDENGIEYDENVPTIPTPSN